MLKGISIVKPNRRQAHSGDDATSAPCLPHLIGAAVIAAAIGCTAKHVYTSLVLKESTGDIDRETPETKTHRQGPRELGAP
jgi:hypothetical protein